MKFAIATHFSQRPHHCILESLMLPIQKMHIGYGHLPQPFSWHVVHHPPVSCRQDLSDTSVPQLAEPQHPATDWFQIIQHAQRPCIGACVRVCVRSSQPDIALELPCRNYLCTKTTVRMLLCMLGYVAVWRLLKGMHDTQRSTVIRNILLTQQHTHVLPQVAPSPLQHLLLCFPLFIPLGCSFLLCAPAAHS